MRRLILIVLLVNLVQCTHQRVDRYRSAIEPRVNKSKKAELDELLGSPVKCEPSKDGLERCEYRTASERNAPIPEVFRRNSTMGPDVSPYEYFDVLHLYYDSFGTLKEWSPVVVH